MRISNPRHGALPDGCVLKAVIRGKTEAEQIQLPSWAEIPEISIKNAVDQKSAKAQLPALEALRDHEHFEPRLFENERERRT
jgi:hypothetical protein